MYKGRVRIKDPPLDKADMNYFIFSNTILLKDEKGTIYDIAKEPSPDEDILLNNEANVCVVDIDVLIAPSVETPVEKKDSILVRKFKELYQHEVYVIQDEKIDTNLFQVIGIKEQKVREVYSLIPAERLNTFIPYGVALRNYLTLNSKYHNKTIIFIDDWGNEKLLTVLNGLKFSRTRVIPNNGEDILPEIKRSQIDFYKKNEEYLSKKNTEYVIVVNNQELAKAISKNEEKLPVEYVNIKYPAFEGLKESNSQIKFRLPEEIVKNRKEIELKNNLKTSVLSITVVAIGLIYFLFNNIETTLCSNQLEAIKQKNQVLKNILNDLDKETYRADLKIRKSLNYGVVYLTVLNTIPSSYEVDSFKFLNTGHWNLEMNLDSGNDGTYDPIPKIGILKNADIKDIFVNGQPEKHLKITL